VGGEEEWERRVVGGEWREEEWEEEKGRNLGRQGNGVTLNQG
jgi:hypothetical protein